MKASVIGLGKLGSCLAVCLAYKGIETIGLDVNRSFVDAINAGKAPVSEPDLQERLAESKKLLAATTEYEDIINKSDITFLVTPTPSEADGHFSDRYLQDALKLLAAALKKSAKEYHLFVVTSTVSPGTTDANLVPLIGKHSGRKLNQGFGVCYSPEFIALGSVIRDFLNPDLLLIGESDRRAGDLLAEIYKITCENKPQVSRMSIISAEITKISLNAYITMKISFANTLASICQDVQGADIDDISHALGADKRISPYYIRGGLAYGGPCFPRDNRAFATFAGKYGHQAILAQATDKVNHAQVHHLIDLVFNNLPTDKTVSVFGLAYKLNTPVIEESASVKLIEELLGRKVRITVFDPLSEENARKAFGDKVEYAGSIEECLSASACWIFALAYPELKSLGEKNVTRNPTVIIDCWRSIDPAQFGKKIKYIALGKAKP